MVVPKPKGFQLPCCSRHKKRPQSSPQKATLIRSGQKSELNSQAMPRLAPLLIIALLIFLLQMPSGHGEGAQGGSIRHDRMLAKIRPRKVLVETQDYDYGGPNTRHDPPKRGKPGSGSKNP